MTGTRARSARPQSSPSMSSRSPVLCVSSAHRRSADKRTGERAGTGRTFFFDNLGDGVPDRRLERLQAGSYSSAQLSEHGNEKRRERNAVSGIMA